MHENSPQPPNKFKIMLATLIASLTSGLPHEAKAQETHTLPVGEAVNAGHMTRESADAPTPRSVIDGISFAEERSPEQRLADARENLRSNNFSQSVPEIAIQLPESGRERELNEDSLNFPIPGMPNLEDDGMEFEGGIVGTGRGRDILGFRGSIKN